MINPKAAMVSAGFVLLTAMAGVWGYLQLPAQTEVAVHFDADGAPDGWMMPFPAFFIMPGLAALLWLFTLVMPRLGRRAANLERAPRAYAVLWMLPALLAVPTQLLILAPSLGLSWSAARLMPAMIGLIFILLGNVMGKIPPNPFVGIRTPWTLKDDWVWDQTHRFGGWVFVGAGFILLGYGLVLPPGGNLRHLVVGVVIAAAIITTVKSWLLSRQRR